MNDYLANSLAWSFVGLFPGMALGYAGAKLEPRIRKWRRHDHP